MSEDERIARARRELAADPSDPEAQRALDSLLLRRHGPEAAAALADFGRWTQASRGCQDAAIGAVAMALSPDFERLEPGQWEEAGRRARLGRFLHRRTGLELALIPGGALPWSTVKPFLIGRFPVRQRVWEAALTPPPPKASPKTLRWMRRALGLVDEAVSEEGTGDRRLFDGGDLPMHGVSWEAAVTWLAALPGALRLPSEAEWELACRAGGAEAYSWGPELDPARCWYAANSLQGPRSVLEHAEKTNAFGLVDALGNVLEACADDYLADAARRPADGRPHIEEGSVFKVARGGSWRDDAERCTCADRRRIDGSQALHALGFRVARDAPEVAGAVATDPAKA